MRTHMTNGCGRGRVTTDDIRRVTCLVCQASQEYKVAKLNADESRRAEIMAQPPRQFREPWREGQILCSTCGGDFFRMGDRTCYGHYENYHCASCGHIESRLTETGMSS